MSTDPTGMRLREIFTPRAIRHGFKDLIWPGGAGGAGAKGDPGDPGPKGDPGDPGPARVGYGPVSARPGAATVAAGFVWFASDEGVEYVSDGAAWHRRELGELGYAEKTDGDFAPATASGRADITNLAPITFDVEAGWIVEVELFCGWIVGANAGAYPSMFIADNAGANGLAGLKAVGMGQQSYQTVAGTKLGQILVRERISAPGTYTRKGQASSNGNVITFKSGNGANGFPPLTLRARRTK